MIMSGSPVIDFYESRSVLITGATGFLGKVIVEKLLRSVPSVKRLFLLIRPQKGLDATQRLEALLKSKLFEKVQLSAPERMSKVVAISGDIMQEDLGLSESDRQMLHADVSVVIHCAATIKFDEALRISVNMNVLGTQRLIAMCHKMPKLAALVHASTAFANCDRPHIMENVYPPPVAPQRLTEALEWMNDDMIQSVTPHLIGKRPNTYTYTKALAEYMLIEESGKLPVAIVRPSIIGAVWKEPCPGWVDNWNGPTGLFAAVGKGLLRSMHGDNSAKADVIPVDTVSNLMIVCAWYIATEKPASIPVINCCSGQLNCVTWKTILGALDTNYNKYPLEGLFRPPFPRFTMSRPWRDLNILIDHYFPAYVLDAVMWLLGKRPKMVKIYQKIFKAVETLEYFTTRQWDFRSSNIIDVIDKLSKEDRKVFLCDIRSLSWDNYLENYCIGVKKYMLNEELSNLPHARKHLNRLKFYSTLMRFLCYLIGFRVLMQKSRHFRSFWNFLLAVANHVTRKIPGLSKLTPLTVG